MKTTIRLARPDDLTQYTAMMQKTYEHAYTSDSIGLTKECFSIEVFNSKDTQDYLKSRLENNAAQQSWMAVYNNKIIGGVVAKDSAGECEMTGFYVLPKFQGVGLGKRLWQKVLNFAGDKDIVLDIYTHNKKAIEMYKKWGFTEDKNRARFYRHWLEWPEGVRAESLYMRRSGVQP